MRAFFQCILLFSIAFLACILFTCELHVLISGLFLDGKVNLCSPDHISLLVHRTFNVSIPRHHIPTDQWEFEYGPAENDPEFGLTTVEESHVDGVTEEPAVSTEIQEQGRVENENVEKGGRWVHKVTGDRLGGASGSLRFTVVG